MGDRTGRKRELDHGGEQAAFPCGADIKKTQQQGEKNYCLYGKKKYLTNKKA